MSSTVRPTQPRSPAASKGQPAVRRAAVPDQAGSLGKDTLQLTRGSQAPRRPAPPAIPSAAPPTVESVHEAVAIALGGKPVLLQDARGRSAALSVVSPAGAAVPTYVMHLDARAMTFAFPGQESAAAREHLPAVMEATLNGRREVIDHIPVLEIGPAEDRLKATVTQNGKSQIVEIQPADAPAGKRAYSFGTADSTLHVLMPDTEDRFQTMTEGADLFAQIPAALRPFLKDLELASGPNPHDAEWAVKYHLPAFKSAAAAGNGKATIYEGNSNLIPAVFHHEFGHVLGQHFSSTGGMVPDDWVAAIASDGKAVSEYGATNPDEDFAESWLHFLTLQQGDWIHGFEASRTLPEFAANFPGRYAILQAIYDGSRKPLN